MADAFAAVLANKRPNWEKTLRDMYAEVLKEKKTLEYQMEFVEIGITDCEEVKCLKDKVMDLEEQLGISKTEAQTFKEDFNEERRDRERSHSENDDLKVEFAATLRKKLVEMDKLRHDKDKTIMTLRQQLDDKKQHESTSKPSADSALSDPNHKTMEDMRKQVATLQKKKENLEIENDELMKFHENNGGFFGPVGHRPAYSPPQANMRQPYLPHSHSTGCDLSLSWDYVRPHNGPPFWPNYVPGYGRSQPSDSLHTPGPTVTTNRRHTPLSRHPQSQFEIPPPRRYYGYGAESRRVDTPPRVNPNACMPPGAYPQPWNFPNQLRLLNKPNPPLRQPSNQAREFQVKLRPSVPQSSRPRLPPPPPTCFPFLGIFCDPW